MALDSKIPHGPISDKWTDYKDHINLVNPANKRNLDIIVVGTGLAGGSRSVPSVTLQDKSKLVRNNKFKLATTPHTFISMSERN
jgi:hypothetical protein